MKPNAAEKSGLTDRWRGLGLTGRQVQFLLEYLQNGRNATNAAVAAGYSSHSAAELGCRTLRNVKVRRALALTCAADVASVEALIARSAEIALDADLADFEPYLDGRMTLAELRQAGVNTRLVKSVKSRTRTVATKDGGRVTTVEREITLYSAMDAIGMLKDLVDPTAITPEEETPMELIELMYARYDKSLKRPPIPGVRPPRLPWTIAGGGEGDLAVGE